MRARVPLDVDLEDRILYGLTPVRLAYVVLAGLAGLAAWESHLGMPWLRGALGAVVLATGTAVAWGRWRGRAADAWLIDVAHFVLSNRRLRMMRKALPPAVPPEEETLAA